MYTEFVVEDLWGEKRRWGSEYIGKGFRNKMPSFQVWKEEEEWGGVGGKEKRREGREDGEAGQEEHHCCSSETVSSGYSCEEKTTLREQSL